MWDLVDENGKYYTNIEEISKDFLLVLMKPEEQMAVRYLMQGNIMYLDGIAELYSTAISIPMMNEYYFGEDVEWRLARIRGDNLKDATRLSVIDAIPQLKEDAYNMTALDFRKLRFVYSPTKDRIFLGGLNQSMDYRYRLLLRYGIPTAYPMQMQLPPRPVHKSLYFDEPIITDTEKYHKLIKMYGFKPCSCGSTAWILEKGRKKACPFCQEQRAYDLFDNIKDEKNRKTIREVMNFPDLIGLPSNVMKGTETYRQIRTILNADVLTVTIENIRDIAIVLASLVELYIERPQFGSWGFEITPICDYRVSNIKKNTERVLVLTYHSKEDIEVLKPVVKHREEKKLKTIVFRS